MNSASAEGGANGLTAFGYAFANVLVTPGLPNTGLPPQANNTSRNVAVFAGILVAALLGFYVVTKKQTA